MTRTVLVLTLAWMASTAAYGADRIGESCSGTETVQIGTQPPKTLPYKLVFNADLTTRSYCYDRCAPDQTYAISDSASHPIKLADVNRGGQIRLMTFDRRTAVLTDHQAFEAGFGKVVRNATATCHKAAFHEPALATHLRHVRPNQS